VGGGGQGGAVERLGEGVGLEVDGVELREELVVEVAGGPSGLGAVKRLVSDCVHSCLIFGMRGQAMAPMTPNDPRVQARWRQQVILQRLQLGGGGVITSSLKFR
jgi:hypothetical protein